MGKKFYKKYIFIYYIMSMYMYRLQIIILKVLKVFIMLLIGIYILFYYMQSNIIYICKIEMNKIDKRGGK